jgi:RNA polymerase sigma-70 factor (ECF subfamily)
MDVTNQRAQSASVEPEAAATDARELAFAYFVESRLPGHYRLAAVILGNPTEAQDAVHDAFERAWRAGPTLRDLDRFDAWVGRILVNECRDRLRLRSRRAVTDISERLSDTLAAPDQLRSAIDRDEIQRAFAALKPDQQIVIALRFYADMTVEQIAERVSAPLGTVKSRLHHALAALHAELARINRSGGLR